MKHFIGKQTIEIRRGSKKDAFEFQQSASRTYRDTILPALNELFDRFSDEEHLISIDKLEIDLGAIGKKEFLEGAFLKDILEQIENQLLRSKTGINEGVIKTSVRLGRFESYLHFIKQGNFPRFSTIPKTDIERDLLDILGLNYSAATQLRKLLSIDEIARRRIVLQFSNKFLTHLVELFTAEKQSELINIFQAIEKAREMALNKSINRKEKQVIEKLFQKHHHSILKGKFSFSYDQIMLMLKKHCSISARKLEIDLWETLLKILFVGSYKASPVGFLPMMFNENPSYRLLLPFLDIIEKEGNSVTDIFQKKENFPIMNIAAISNLLELQDAKLVKSMIPADELNLEPNKPDIRQEEGWHIGYAGLVLFHPFIPNLFEKTGLTENKIFLSETHRQSALGLLQYIVSGKEKAFEFELTLPKLLCGVPLGIPVDAGLQLTEELKEDANNLINVVIEHWDAIGNVSPDSLREGFLNREGKLIQEDSRWHLHVEKKTIDLLLDQLPWGIGMVRLPWMKEMLIVDWN